MKEIQLTQGKAALVDDADFDWLNQWKWFANRKRYTYYVVRGEKRRTIFMHRLITNCPDGLQVDHINHDGLDNRRENLRVCTHTENNRNRRSFQISNCGFKGVCWRRTKKRFGAYVHKNGKQVFAGFYKTPEEAARAYDAKALELFGEFAWLNFPEALP